MVEVRELEEALAKLPSVDAVRVVANGENLTEVHVLSGLDKPAKQVVRDIQSLAMARFGLSVDRRTVSVVQIEDSRQGSVDRPTIVGIKESPDGPRTTVGVTLGWRGEHYMGSATGPSATATRLRLVGEATLAALEEALGSDIALALESVGVPTIGNRPVAVALVVTVVDVEEHVAVGSALVRNDPAEATVRAVLDAMNRRVPHLRR